jgi:tetratricopeptide (TPR) repeat protein
MAGEFSADCASEILSLIFRVSSSSAIGLDATNPVFYCNRAAAFSRIGEYQKAVDDCNQAIRYDPNYGKGEIKFSQNSIKFHNFP